MRSDRHPPSRDPLYAAPFIDTDEWRDDPVPHRYVHGGFEGTEARFSFYFPPPEQYEGRFFQPLPAMVGNEHLAMAPGARLSVDFAAASGAYLVESNLGWSRTHLVYSDNTIHGYRASAAAANHSRVVAAEMYGDHRAFGYCSGGSGGGWRTIACLENSDAWDGGVPFIHPHPATFPTMLSADAHAIRLLRDKAAGIADALDPGGSGDMFAGLTLAERDALAMVTRLGFPPRALFFTEDTARIHAGFWSGFAQRMLAVDPEYFEDFWTVRGYLGAEDPSLLECRVQQKTTIASVVTVGDLGGTDLGMTAAALRGVGDDKSTPVALVIADLPDTPLVQGATLAVTSGAAAGRSFFVVDRMDGGAVAVSSHDALEGVAAGDEVVLDNAHHLAYQTYHRHQVDPDFAEWDQFCADGRPMYPQRAELMGPRLAREVAGSNYAGRFAGKMIVVQNLMDEGAWPNIAVYYRGLVESHLGDRIDDQYRLWFTDHAMHGAPSTATKTTRIVDYAGAVQQALRDVAAWVEEGTAPPASTQFELSDGQVHVPDSAADRRGIQPVVHVTADGGSRAGVTVGQPVLLRGVAEVPAGAGTIVAAEWDFDGRGDFPAVEQGIAGAQRRMTFTTEHTFTEPGTWFAVLRVIAQRQGDTSTPHARVQNLGRARVVVRP